MGAVHFFISHDTVEKCLIKMKMILTWSIGSKTLLLLLLLLPWKKLDVLINSIKSKNVWPRMKFGTRTKSVILWPRNLENVFTIVSKNESFAWHVLMYYVVQNPTG